MSAPSWIPLDTVALYPAASVVVVVVVELNSVERQPSVSATRSSLQACLQSFQSGAEAPETGQLQLNESGRLEAVSRVRQRAFRLSLA